MQKLLTLFFDDELTMEQIEHLFNEPYFKARMASLPLISESTTVPR